MTTFQDRFAAVTGAARGIGLATAKRLAADGATVFMLDLPTSDGEVQAAQLRADGLKAQFIPTDVSQEESVRAAAATIRAAALQLDYLVNVAGTNVHARIQDMSLEQWNRMLSVNVTGMFLTLKHLSPLMTNGGAVVNMGSVSAFIGTDGYTAYHMTKGAVTSFTTAAAQEFAASGIRVNVVAPGWVDTDFTDNALAQLPNADAVRAGANTAHMLGRIAQPDEVAAAIAFLLSPDASFITGTTLFVDGGFMAKH